MKRAVYTIRDHEGWVRYVGSSSNPDVRYGNHWQSATPIGKLMREEHAAGRAMYLRVEEWFDTTAEGYKAETQYIRGYAKLSGDKLLNMRKPKSPAKTAYETCIREGCNRRLNMLGLCSRHVSEYFDNLLSLPQKQRQEYYELCVEHRLIVPDEEDPVIDCRTIAESLKAKRRAELDAQKAVKKT